MWFGRQEEALDFSAAIKYNEGMKAKPKKKMGRPPKAPADRLDARVTVKMTHAERKRLEEIARREGLPLAHLLMKPWREEGEKP